MWTDVLIAVAAAVVAALIGWPLVPAFLRLTHAGPGSKPERTGAEDVEVLRGGMWIGIVERALIAGAIVLGRPELMAVVIAVKGLGRFAEIKSSAAAGERFIIGTFVSIAFASLIGIIGWAIIT
ncbi:hypothetical protein [Brevibacterium spongiae]|uniref:DUF4345 domain-containing protein n=1 Tax=Brevibacterium spongiae TaxID=2909672 RepID=A0ABY5SP38_9MICO|nr:hypothetical protein [Brevibacterium spongiae]UVI34839.1 hypothetical protein L1F31_11965 [Brevibacterium spongiae]